MKRSLFGAVAFAVAAASVVLIGAASAAKPPAPPAPTGNCPASGITNYPVASNVDASFTINAPNVTYSFTADSNGNTNTGLPGLVGLCVYTDGTATGAVAKESDWKAGFNNGNVSFARGGGNKTNIAYSTAAQEVGTATFSTLPTTKHDILLHIADSAACAGQPTCYVQPNPGPICDAGTGNTDAAYNSIPTDIEHCGPPSRAFQAQQTSEFGDAVGLSTAGGTHLSTMTVDFQSYACIDGGFWLNGTCEDDPAGATYPIPDSFSFPGSGGITANIYAAGPVDGFGNVTLGALIATAHSSEEIPFRPAADPTHCQNPGIDSNGGNDTGKWYDAAANTCRYSVTKLITFTGFTAPGGGPLSHTFTDGEKVIWTVAFNTETWGYHPIGVNGPYTALNVGTMSYSNVPFAGSDLEDHGAFVYASSNSAYCDNGTGGINVLRDDIDNPVTPCSSTQYTPQDPDQAQAWHGYRPLAEIVLVP